MPPRGHSSSSHSSFHSSSHSSSSFRSSSSSFRSSSSSSFKSPSSHSSSSRSSSRSSYGGIASKAGGSGGAGRSVGGAVDRQKMPSSHSTTSRQSNPMPSQSYTPPRTVQHPAPAPKPEIFHAPYPHNVSHPPRYYYGRRHNYVYYPVSWMDTTSGTFYDSGYYDESGKYYNSVALQTNDKYENVTCKCAYCGAEQILTLDNSVGSTQELKCPNCGAQMEIKSELDELIEKRDEPVQVSTLFNPESSPVTASEPSYDRSSYDPEFKDDGNKRAWRFAIIAVVLGLIIYAGRYLASRPKDPTTIQTDPGIQSVEMVESDTVTITDTIVYDDATPGKTYTIVGTVIDKDSGEALLDPEGNPYTVYKEFTPDSRHGTILLEISVSRQNLGGKNLVISETIKEGSINSANASGIQIVPGQPVYLELQGDGYHVVNDPVRADRILYWDAAADSWYDRESDCWLWYNTDVEPAVWQYWYEGISSDYGDYGWMEHYSDGWFIEASNGNWVSLPSIYGADGLWYIES